MWRGLKGGDSAARDDLENGPIAAMVMKGSVLFSPAKKEERRKKNGSTNSSRGSSSLSKNPKSLRLQQQRLFRTELQRNAEVNHNRNHNSPLDVCVPRVDFEDCGWVLVVVLRFQYEQPSNNGLDPAAAVHLLRLVVRKGATVDRDAKARERKGAKTGGEPTFLKVVDRVYTDIELARLRQARRHCNRTIGRNFHSA